MRTNSLYLLYFTAIVLTWNVIICQASEQSLDELALFSTPNITCESLNCEFTTDGPTTVIRTTEKDAILTFDLAAQLEMPALHGPSELHFRMKTKFPADLGEYIVYWVTEDVEGWTKFERVPLIPDGHWHDYRIPLAGKGVIKSLRLSLGAHAHDIEITGARIVGNRNELPAELSVQKSAMPPELEIVSPRLKCHLNSQDHSYRILDQLTGRTWHGISESAWLTLVSAEKVDDQILSLQLYDRFAGQLVKAEVSIFENQEIKFSIKPTQASQPLYSASRFPPCFASDYQDGHLVFCDRSCGVLLDQSDSTYGNWPLRVYGNTHCLDMPWVGMFDDERSDGAMLLVDTPADAEVAFVKHADGRHWPEVRWLPSLDTFGYERRASYRFTSSGRYVQLAQEYRSYLQKQGRLKTLRDKALVKPQVERLRGAASLWGARDNINFIHETRPLGIKQGIVGNSRDPEQVTWLNSLGYLTGRYDSYTDILEGPLGFQKDNVEKAAIRPRPGGSPKLGWKLRSGHQMYWRSSASWLTAAESYVPQELAKLPYNSRFIDVAAAADLLEDYHPEHTLDRRQDLANRRALFEKMNGYGLVLGTEHGNDWVVDLIEYLEGGMSGPFWWSSWPAGYLDAPTREQLSEKYLKFGMGYAHRVPLWELVFHDCVINTWYWGDTAGLLYKSAPELADRKDLFNILYGTPPLIWMNNTGYKWPEDAQRLLRTFHDTCPLHEVVAFEQLTDHEFLTADRAVQRTRFANGTVAIVNFADEPREMVDGDLRITLAPRGYYVSGPAIKQSRLWVNGHAHTVISKPGYLTVAGPGDVAIENIKSAGRITMMRVDDERWNLFIEPDHSCQMNVSYVTGWASNESLRLHRMDPTGTIGEELAIADSNGTVEFKSTPENWRFALVRNPMKIPATASATQAISSTRIETRAN